MAKNSLNELDDKYQIKLTFIIEQLSLLNTHPNHRRYTSSLILNAMRLLLCSSSAYTQLREMLVLPHKQTLKKYISKTSDSGSLDHCKKLLNTFCSSNLAPENRVCNFIVDEIYVKPSLAYQRKIHPTALLGQCLQLC